MSIAKSKPTAPQGDTTVYNATPKIDPATGQAPWGTIDNTAVAATAWSVPSIAAGASSTTTVAVPGSQPGDFIDVAATPPTAMPAGVAILAFIAAAGTVTLNAVNNGASASVAATVNLSVRVSSAGLVQSQEAMALRSK